MASNHPLLEHGHYYHIYNRGINSCALFRKSGNYEHFLRLYDKYILPVADTYAWVLMGNHFHLLVRIKSKEELHLQGFDNLEGVYSGRNLINQHFSNLFNAYTKAYNKMYKRSGSLFEHPFRRIKITSEEYLKYLIYYIHNNPIHHGFCEHLIEFPWSSYLTILSPKKTKLKRDEVLEWYNDPDNFKDYHNRESINRFSELQLDEPIISRH